MTRLMSTTSRGVRHRCKRPQPPPAVLRPSNSHQQYHGCQKQHRSTSCRSAYHRQSAPPPTCPWLQVESFSLLGALACSAAVRGARAAPCARVALCALCALPERAAPDEGDSPAPPLSSSTNQPHLRQVSPGSYSQHYGRRSHLRPGLLTHVNTPVVSNLDSVPSPTGNHRADTLACNQDLRLHSCWKTYRVAALCLLQD